MCGTKGNAKLFVWLSMDGFFNSPKTFSATCSAGEGANAWVNDVVVGETFEDEVAEAVAATETRGGWQGDGERLTSVVDRLVRLYDGWCSRLWMDLSFAVGAK